ncbi:MAG: hypothetical protein M3536_03360 [Actinomycetota bacterium]|nr:hypothetical protein [Actinomycetota bacterium]
MPQTRANKITVPVNSDAYNLTTDLAAMADSANVVIRVSSAAERDALVKVAGLCVTRSDLGGLIEVCDGTNWLSSVKRRRAEFTGTSDGTTGAGAAWQFSVLTKDTGNSFNDAFVTASASKSRITFAEAGTYIIHVKVGVTAAPGVSYTSIKNSADTYAHGDGNNGTGADWGVTASAGGVYVAAGGTDILFGLRTANAVTAAQCTVRILVTKISD